MFVVVALLFAFSLADVCHSGKSIDSSTLSSLVSSLNATPFDSKRIDLLTMFLNTTSLGLTGGQTVQVLSTFGFSTTKVTALNVLGAHLLGFSCSDVVNVSSTLGFASDQLSVLPSLVNLVYQPDLLANNASIVNMFSFNSDRQTALEIIQNATGISCTFGPISQPRVIFVIDVSGSMSTGFTFNGVVTTRLSFVQNELANVIGHQLRAPVNYFNIESFSSSTSFWAPGLQIASPANAVSAVSFARSLVASGGTQTGLALTGAWAEPDVMAVYLLSDGNPDDPSSSYSTLQKLFNAKPIPVYATALAADSAGKQFMQMVANYTGGVYREINGD